jgi:peroxiredoxin
MTYEEELAWAQAEHIARIADLRDRTPEGLSRAQSNAEARRKAVGLSSSRVAMLVKDAGSIRRREEMRAAATGTPT